MSDTSKVEFNIEEKQNRLRFEILLNSSSFGMASSSVISYLKNSLKMKISKKMIRCLFQENLTIKQYPNGILALVFHIIKSDTNNESSHSLYEIPEEGEIYVPYSSALSHIDTLPPLIDLLIVDDIKLNIAILERIVLTLPNACKCQNLHRNFTMHSANSGEETLELLAKQNSIGSGYKVVIMDCMMPGLDGWETSEAIREMFSKKEIKVLPYILAYSATGSSTDLDNCERAGMCGHISKPCYQEDLCASINEWINKPVRRHVS